MNTNKMNEYFHRGPIFYVLYVVLKGIWSLPYRRVYVIYVIPFGE